MSAYFDGDIAFLQNYFGENYNRFVYTFSHLIHYWEKANLANGTIDDEQQFKAALYDLVVLIL
jgi:hypothetical protein